MPSTLGCVRDIIERLPAPCLDNLILLVVPGLDWTDDQLKALHGWQAGGIRLAGHGWTHETREVRRLYHRLHSLFISRRAAEHLCLTAAEIEDMLVRNRAWFRRNGFDVPALYVPPAWALGPISSDALARTGWRYLETTSAIVDIETGRSLALPLVGFEADTWLRQVSLGLFNRLNELIASERRPLRVAIHPFDYDHRLSAQLERITGAVAGSLTCEQVLA